MQPEYLNVLESIYISKKSYLESDVLNAMYHSSKTDCTYKYSYANFTHNY